MPRLKLEEGQTFGRLRVIAFAGINRRRETTWRCRCDCGSEIIVAGLRLTSGDTRTCGCWRHGHARNGTVSPEYVSWHAMLQRCSDPNRANYKHYGARGIKVCRRWRTSFHNFFADMGKRPSRLHSIHRLRNDGNYCPSNCVWATIQEQSLKRRNVKLTQLKADKIRARYYAGEITQRELGAQYGISQTAVSKVVLGQRWPDLPPKKPSISVKQDSAMRAA